MMLTKFTASSVALAFCALFQHTAWAQMPPQPAIDACAGKNAGSSCSFSSPNGTVSGFCALTPENVLVCDPNATGSSNGGTSTVPTDIGTTIGSTGGVLPDTGQTYCYDTNGSAVSCPSAGQSGYGQDAQYQSNALSYTNNGDGTISDNVTGLMWSQTTDLNGDGKIDAGDKLNLSNARTYCQDLTLGGHSDWWLPDIKQLYSLMNFDGQDVSSYTGTDTSGLVPFIDTRYFAFGYGDTSAGERIIDAQYASNTEYVSTTMNGNATVFGVNFADGRIKGYPISVQGTDKTYYVLCARGNSSYGQNNFTDNTDGTITDSAAGLMWARDDSGTTLTWDQALTWVEQRNAASYLGYGDWRLPNIKELQGLVDYKRSPDTTSSAAISALFNATAIVNEAGQNDYAYYWSNTTHLTSDSVPGKNAAYISFGRAIGSLDSGATWIDVHGAGAQRSDPKVPESGVSYPNSHGPQGDAQRVYNYARLVRTAPATTASDTSQCAVYDAAATPSISVPCVNVGGALYEAGMNLVDGQGLRFEVDMNSLAPISSSAGADCAEYPYGPQSLLRLNCVNVGGSKLWAELLQVPGITTIQFDVTGYGNR